MAKGAKRLAGAGGSRISAGFASEHAHPGRVEADIPFELPKVTAKENAQALELLKMLRESYPDAHCELDYKSPHEFLIATILSAQTTDVGVNKATPALFKKFPTPADYATSTP